VGVKNPEGLPPQKLAELQDPVRVSGVVARKGEYTEAFLMRPQFKQAAFRTNHQLFVTSLSETACEQQELPLPTSQLFTGIDVHHLHSYHHGEWLAWLAKLSSSA
jgi:hypothetical protein